MTRNAPLAEQAERLRTLGQDPVRWLATLAELEEKLLGWKRAHGIAELGPAEAVRAIREARVWCAPIGHPPRWFPADGHREAQDG